MGPRISNLIVFTIGITVTTIAVFILLILFISTVSKVKKRRKSRKLKRIKDGTAKSNDLIPIQVLGSLEIVKNNQRASNLYSVKGRGEESIKVIHRDPDIVNYHQDITSSNPVSISPDTVTPVVCEDNIAHLSSGSSSKSSSAGSSSKSSSAGSSSKSSSSRSESELVPTSTARRKNSDASMFSIQEESGFFVDNSGHLQDLQMDELEDLYDEDELILSSYENKSIKNFNGSKSVLDPQMSSALNIDECPSSLSLEKKISKKDLIDLSN